MPLRTVCAVELLQSPPRGRQHGAAAYEHAVDVEHEGRRAWGLRCAEGSPVRSAAYMLPAAARSGAICGQERIPVPWYGARCCDLPMIDFKLGYSGGTNACISHEVMALGGDSA